MAILESRRGTLFSLRFMKFYLNIPEAVSAPDARTQRSVEMLGASFPMEEIKKEPHITDIDWYLWTLLNVATGLVERERGRTLLPTKYRIIHKNLNFQIPYGPFLLAESITYGLGKKKPKCWENEATDEILAPSNYKGHYNIQIPQNTIEINKDFNLEIVYWGGHLPENITVKDFRAGCGHEMKKKYPENPHCILDPLGNELAMDTADFVGAFYINSVLEKISNLYYGRENIEKAKMTMKETSLVELSQDIEDDYELDIM